MTVMFGDERVPRRIWDRVVEVESGCWVWTGRIKSKGQPPYGKTTYKDKEWFVHRLVLHFIGELRVANENGERLVTDHLCRNTLCCNPEHLELVTNRVNVIRGRCAEVNRIRQGAKIHCPYGHMYSPGNTRIGSRGERKCRECDRINMARRRAGLPTISKSSNDNAQIQECIQGDTVIDE